MGWILKAEGQISGTAPVSEAEHERLEVVERELCERFRALLSDPRYGTVAATLSGDEILGWPDSAEPMR